MTKLTHDIQVVLEWTGDDWSLFLPTDELSTGTGAFPNELRRWRCAATLHIPLNGKEKPFLTSSAPEFRSPAVEGWTV